MSKFARFFKPFSSTSDTFQSCFIFATKDIVSYEYNKKWCGTGQFSLILPLKKDIIRKALVNNIVYYDDDWLMITSLSYNNNQITLTGVDLNGLLDNRITVFGKAQVAGAEGYDVVKGTTGDCINHYINNNLVLPEDKSRQIPNMVIDKTVAGLSDDSYMARLKILSDVVCDLCNNANIGYRIDGDLQRDKYRFSTLTGVDHSANQRSNPYVILSTRWGNIVSSVFTHSVDNLFNAIYATGADVTQTVYRDNDIPNGFSRRETAVDVTVNSVDDIKTYALYNMQDNIETHSYELDVKSTGLYGNKFDLGDTVTVIDSFTNNKFTSQIVEVKKTISNSQRKISVILGKQNQKLLNRIITGIYNRTLKRK